VGQRPLRAGRQGPLGVDSGTGWTVKEVVSNQWTVISEQRSAPCYRTGVAGEREKQRDQVNARIRCDVDPDGKFGNGLPTAECAQQSVGDEGAGNAAARRNKDGPIPCSLFRSLRPVLGG
jgi:hypothetical protein